jgi:hypothetical protein
MQTEQNVTAEAFVQAEDGIVRSTRKKFRKRTLNTNPRNHWTWCWELAAVEDCAAAVGDTATAATFLMEKKERCHW